MNTHTQQQAYIEGFVKRASEYGFNEHEAIQLLQKQANEESVGPWDAQAAAEMVATEAKLKALTHNKSKHPGHYYFNPFVGGPITEALTRLQRRQTAGLAGEHGIARHLLGGGLLNTIQGDEKMRAAVRERYNTIANGYGDEA